MLSIARLVVVDRAELPSAYSTRGVHRLEPCPVLSPQVPVGVPRVLPAPGRHDLPPQDIHMRSCLWRLPHHPGGSKRPPVLMLGPRYCLIAPGLQHIPPAYSYTPPGNDSGPPDTSKAPGYKQGPRVQARTPGYKRGPPGTSEDPRYIKTTPP